MFPILLEIVFNFLHPDVIHKVFMNLLILSDRYKSFIKFGLNQWYKYHNRKQLIVIYLESCRFSQKLSKSFDNINIQLYNIDFKFFLYPLNSNGIDYDISRYNIYGFPAMIFLPDTIRNPNEIDNYHAYHGAKTVEELIDILNTNKFDNQFS